MTKYLPLSVPFFNGNESKYTKECIETEWVSSAGKYVDLFEQKIAEYTGAKYAVATVNGTAALQVALRLAGVKEDDEVIIPSLTFIAPVNAIKYNGAYPVFMDSDKYYNIDPEKTIEFILKKTYYKSGNSYNSSTGKKITAIIPVHVWGNAVYLDDLLEICKERNIIIVEDASESLGTFYTKSKYESKHTGTIGDLGCISFNGNKIITTGGGGMILTDSSDFAEKAKYLTTQAKDDPVRYIHNEIGYNFRLTNIQAALGVAQLEQIDGFLNQKKEIYGYYKEGIKKIYGLDIFEVPNYAKNNYWLNILQIDTNYYGEDIEKLMFRLEDLRIQTRPVWQLNHLQKSYKNCESYFIENAKKLIKNSLCIPSSPVLIKNSYEDLDRIISALNK